MVMSYKPYHPAWKSRLTPKVLKILEKGPRSFRAVRHQINLEVGVGKGHGHSLLRLLEELARKRRIRVTHCDNKRVFRKSD